MFERKDQIQGLRNQKMRSLHLVNEQFSDERNAEAGIFFQAFYKLKKPL